MGRRNESSLEHGYGRGRSRALEDAGAIGGRQASPIPSNYATGWVPLVQVRKRGLHRAFSAGARAEVEGWTLWVGETIRHRLWP
jgi:hypothetical protein